MGLQIDAVGAGEGLKSGKLEVPQPFFLRQHGVGVADVEAFGWQVEVSWRDELEVAETQTHSAGTLYRVGNALEPGPGAGIAAGGIAKQAQWQEVMDRGRVEHGDSHADQHRFRLVRGRG